MSYKLMISLLLTSSSWVLAAPAAKTDATSQPEAATKAAPAAKAEGPAKEAPAKHHHNIMRFDSNGDNVVTKEEFLASTSQRFAALDVDGNKLLTLTEFSQRYHDHKAKWAKDKALSMTPQDGNKDGLVSKDEYLQSAEAKFKEKDSNSDQKLSKEELEGAADSKKLPPAGGADTEKVFTKMDANGDKQITPEEYSAARSKWFTTLDKNADGKVTMDELKP